MHDIGSWRCHLSWKYKMVARIFYVDIFVRLYVCVYKLETFLLKRLREHCEIYFTSLQFKSLLSN